MSDDFASPQHTLEASLRLVSIGIATPAHEERVIATLLLAFGADPIVRWLYPDPREYVTTFPVLAKTFGGRAFEQGTAYRTEDHAGAALWLPPGVGPDEEAMIDLLERSVAPERQAAAFAVLEQMDAFHPTEPHWYLPLIGVDPAQQNRGIGAALLQPVLAQCDRDGIPAYLESSNPRNISLYERHGFEIVGTLEMGGTPLYPMVRRPRPSP